MRDASLDRRIYQECQLQPPSFVNHGSSDRHHLSGTLARAGIIRV
jgi:hypothetical protein